MQLTKTEANYLIRLIDADIMSIEEDIEILAWDFGEVPTEYYEELVMARRLRERIEEGGIA